MRFFYVFLLGSIFLYNSCKKYEEGPSLSIRTIKNRITNNWNGTSSLFNDTLYTFSGTTKYSYWCGCNTYNSSVKELTLNLNKDGKFSFHLTMNSTFSLWGMPSNKKDKFDGTGAWELYDDDKKLRLTFNAWMKYGNFVEQGFFTNSNIEEYEIIRLKMNEVKLKYLTGTTGYFYWNVEKGSF